MLVRPHEECSLVRQGWGKLHGLVLPFAEVYFQWFGEGREVRPSNSKADGSHAAPDSEPHTAGRDGLRLLPGFRDNPDRGRADRARLLRPGTRSEVCGRIDPPLAAVHGKTGRAGRRRANLR